jgi:anti-anti-sigma regulatory factor
MADSKTVQTVALPAVLNLDALDQVRDGLLDAVDAGPVAIDASGVERVATNALLMLISAAQTAQRNGFAFELGELSAPMRAAIDRLGLRPHFSLMMKG